MSEPCCMGPQTQIDCSVMAFTWPSCLGDMITDVACLVVFLGLHSDGTAVNCHLVALGALSIVL